jgi:hypothetical protein
VTPSAFVKRNKRIAHERSLLTLTHEAASSLAAFSETCSRTRSGSRKGHDAMNGCARPDRALSSGPFGSVRACNGRKSSHRKAYLCSPLNNIALKPPNIPNWRGWRTVLTRCVNFRRSSDVSPNSQIMRNGWPTILARLCTRQSMQPHHSRQTSQRGVSRSGKVPTSGRRKF